MVSDPANDVGGLTRWVFQRPVFVSDTWENGACIPTPHGDNYVGLLHNMWIEFFGFKLRNINSPLLKGLNCCRVDLFARS